MIEQAESKETKKQWVEIRKATKADLQEIINIWINSDKNTLIHHKALDPIYYPDSYEQFSQGAVEYITKILNNKDEQDGFVMLYISNVLENAVDGSQKLNQSILGAIIIDNYNQNTRIGEITELFKDRMVKSLVGMELSKAALEYLKEKGIERVNFEVHAANRLAWGLYEIMGAQSNKLVMMKKIIPQQPESLFSIEIPHDWKIELKDNVIKGQRQRNVEIYDGNGKKIAKVNLVHDYATYFDTQIREYILVDVIDMPEINYDGVVNPEVYPQKDPYSNIEPIINMLAEKFAVDEGLGDLMWVIDDTKNRDRLNVMRQWLKYRDTIRKMYFDLRTEPGESEPNYIKLSQEHRKKTKETDENSNKQRALVAIKTITDAIKTLEEAGITVKKELS